MSCSFLFWLMNCYNLVGSCGVVDVVVVRLVSVFSGVFFSFLFFLQAVLVYFFVVFLKSTCKHHFLTLVEFTILYLSLFDQYNQHCWWFHAFILKVFVSVFFIASCVPDLSGTYSDIFPMF